MHLYRWHSAVKVGVHGPLVSRHPLHLQQSDLDSACGPHCLLMALIIFGLVERAQLRTLRKERRNALATLWQSTEANFFLGTGPRSLQLALTPYGQQLHCQHARTHCIAQALEALSEGGVAIVHIENAHFAHWVLAIGVGGREQQESFCPSELLILDPGHAALPLGVWNATLSVGADRQDRHLYTTPAGALRVRVEHVVSLRPRLLPD